MHSRQQSLLPGQALENQKPETVLEAVKLYELVYMPSRNFSAKTRINYRHDLTDLLDFLERRGVQHLDQVSPRNLEAYLADLDARGYAGTSRQRKVYAIKSFFGFLHDSRYLKEDVSHRLVPPKTEYKEPRVLTKREYMALTRACSDNPRDSAIVELLLQTGLRLAEVARLGLDDVELPVKITRSPDTMGRLHVLGKGRKDRWIPLNYKVCRALKIWLKMRPEVDHDALFVSKHRQSLGARSIQHVVKKYLREAGIKGASVHTLRHTFATHHVAQGTSLRTVQEMLGHASLKTTSIYVQLAQEVVRKELQEHAL
jgi:site-specific recombinase XerD